MVTGLAVNGCFHSVQRILFSSVQPGNWRIQYV